MVGPSRILPRKGDRHREPHRDWNARAADYRQLAFVARNPEIRQVLDHLALTCAGMAKATNPRVQARPDDRSLHASDVMRESTGGRWRIREAEYRAIAGHCENDAGKLSWTTIAERCAALADYLDRTRT
jgi:hypothetical protein